MIIYATPCSGKTTFLDSLDGHTLTTGPHAGKALSSLIFDTDTLEVRLADGKSNRTVRDCVIDKAVALHLQGYVILTNLPDLSFHRLLRHHPSRMECIRFTRPLPSTKKKMHERAAPFHFDDEFIAEMEEWTQTSGYLLQDNLYLSSDLCLLKEFLTKHFSLKGKTGREDNFNAYLRHLQKEFPYHTVQRAVTHSGDTNTSNDVAFLSQAKRGDYGIK